MRATCTLWWKITAPQCRRGYFYGAATATEQRVSATLSDLAVSFVVEYIMGQRTEADWASFQSSWNELGGADWTAEVNEQYNSIVNPQ